LSSARPNSSFVQVASDYLHEAGIGVRVDEGWHASDPAYEGSFLLTSVSGGGTGIMIPPGFSRSMLEVTLADQVQDFIIEELWTLGRSTSWPECPDHPNTHPLRAHMVDGAGMWICHRNGRVIRPLRSIA